VLFGRHESFDRLLAEYSGESEERSLLIANP
jgi:hypothetical protein